MECLYTNGVSKDAQERLNVFMFIVSESCLPGAEVEGPDIQSKVGLFVFVEYHFCGVMI